MMEDTTNETQNELIKAGKNHKENTSFGPSFVMPEAGQRIGPNRILELIAEGGMANVYKVWHEGLEILRAIKILKPGFNEESMHRLHTEAKISAHLHHPNIVEIYGVNLWKESIPYLEMEYIDGFSLKDLMKYQKRLHFSFAISIGYFVCIALNYAHNQVFTLYGKPYQGVIHRDIKPANILISRSGTVKLADFGIAKPSEISLHTVGHKVMGTFSYLSPEQLNGEPLDRRCDIYSLGAVLYEIITGAKAFPQKTLSELIQKKMQNQFRPLNAFGIDCPKQIYSIIDKSMDLKRDKRYATASDFADDLVGLLKKCTDKTPDQIIVSYIKNPESAPRMDLKKGKRIPSIVFATLIPVVSLVVFLMLFLPGVRKDFAPFLNRHEAVDSNAVERSKSPFLKDKTVQPQPRPNTESSSAQDTLLFGKETEHPAISSVDQLKAGINAAKTNHPKEAIKILAPVMKKKPPAPDTLKAAAAVYLLQSYVTVKDMEDARSLIASEPINDGYYYYLCGKVYYTLAQFDQAIESFGKAQTISSRYHKETLREATFEWAKTLYKICIDKPNADNKRACSRAWQQYSRAFCGDSDNSTQCEEAVRVILEMEK